MYKKVRKWRVRQNNKICITNIYVLVYEHVSFERLPYLQFTEVEVNSEVNNCFSIYHTNWVTSGSKNYFTEAEAKREAILFLLGFSEVNSTLLITSELTNQNARKTLFTCVVYTNVKY